MVAKVCVESYRRCQKPVKFFASGLNISELMNNNVGSAMCILFCSYMSGTTVTVGNEELRKDFLATKNH